MNVGDSNSSPPRTGFAETVGYMRLKKIDTLLWLTRLGTVVFTILFLVPVFNVNSYTCYQRALLSNAATNALRLHQRMPRVQFTREFGALLIIEDSCHYLLYSVLFIFTYPVTLSLLPIFLFAVLHSSHYSTTLLNKLGGFPSLIYRLDSIVRNQRNILWFVALTEVALMPVTVFLTLSGKGSLMTPLAFYTFLLFRYASRRNPYTRTVFHEMRMSLENFGNSTSNLWIKNICTKVIYFVSWLAPPAPIHQ